MSKKTDHEERVTLLLLLENCVENFGLSVVIETIADVVVVRSVEKNQPEAVNLSKRLRKLSKEWEKICSKKYL